MTAAGLNPVDLKFLWADKLPTWCHTLAQWLVEGYGVGFDFCGIVEYAPINSGFIKGDEVYGTMPPMKGSVAEYISVPLHQVQKKPCNFSCEEAAALPLVGLTCVQAFDDNNLANDQHVLIIGGSGGVGHVAIQVAKARGAFVTTIYSERNFEFVKKLGADCLINYNDKDKLIDELNEIVKKKGPFDIVFDTVSSHDPRDRVFGYENMIRNPKAPLMKKGNNNLYIMIGGVFKDWVCALLKTLFKINLFARGRLLFWVRFPYSSNYLKSLTKFAEDGKLKISVSKILPFSTDGVTEGFKLLKDRRTKGKIVISLK